MPLVNGTSLNLQIDGNYIGGAVSSSLALNSDLPDSTTKDDLGWASNIYGLRSGTISTDCLVTSLGITFDDLALYMINRTRIDFYFSSNSIIVEGIGFIESIEEIAEREGAANYSVEIKVSGTAAQRTDSYLLLETGDFLLLETGDKLILENVA